MTIDLKALTPDTTIPNSNAVIFGADSQSAAAPSVYSLSTLINFLGGLPQVISVNSSGDALRITQTGSGNALVVEDSASPDSTPFVVNASGNLIMGHTDTVSVPWAGGTMTTAITCVGGNSAGAGIGLVGHGSTSDSNGPTISAARSLGTVDARLPIAVNDLVLALIGSGYDGTAFIRAAQIHAAIDGTPDTNDMPGRLVFSTTADGASSPTERMRIDSSGNVGIGRTASARLDVLDNSTNDAVRITQTGSGNALVVEDSASTDITPFVVTGAGQIIKGHTAAIVSGTISSPGAATQIHSFSTFRDAQLELASWVASPGSDAGLVFFKSPSATVGTQALVSSSDHLGKIRFFGSDGNTAIESAKIEAYVDGTPGTNDMPGRLVFSTTADGASSPTPRMTITSAGEVLIAGTTDQGAYNLQVNGTGVWGAGAYVNGSDQRIKENILPLISGLDIITKLNPVTFQYKQSWTKDTAIQPGFIAQDLLNTLKDEPYLNGIVKTDGPFMSVSYQTLIPILTKAIQELKYEIDSLKAQLQG